MTREGIVKSQLMPHSRRVGILVRFAQMLAREGEIARPPKLDFPKEVAPEIVPQTRGLEHP